MVGNDIVDLQDPDADFGSYRSRFDERVFSESERRSIDRATSPERQRWRLWAAKEASFKLARKRDPSTLFSPRAFSVDCDEGSRAIRVRVIHDELPCFVEFDETKKRIHAIAVPAPGDFADVISGVDVLEHSSGGASQSERESQAVRDLACDAISQRFNFSRHRLEIRRAAQRIPMLYHGEALLDLSVSLSHHGSWLGFACRAACHPTCRPGVDPVA